MKKAKLLIPLCLLLLGGCASNNPPQSETPSESSTPAESSSAETSSSEPSSEVPSSSEEPEPSLPEVVILLEGKSFKIVCVKEYDQYPEYKNYLDSMIGTIISFNKDGIFTWKITDNGSVVAYGIWNQDGNSTSYTVTGVMINGEKQDYPTEILTAYDITFENDSICLSFSEYNDNKALSPIIFHLIGEVYNEN